MAPQGPEPSPAPRRSSNPALEDTVAEITHKLRYVDIPSIVVIVIAVGAPMLALLL